MRSRKTRHRRTGSQGGSGNYSNLAENGSTSPKVSSNHDHKATVVDSETQTETMDISETDTSPNPVGDRDFPLMLVERPGFLLGLKHDNVQQRNSSRRPSNSPEDKTSPSAWQSASSSDRERRRWQKSKQNCENPNAAAERTPPPKINFEGRMEDIELPRLRKLSLENNNCEEQRVIGERNSSNERVNVECDDNSNGNSQSITKVPAGSGDGDRTNLRTAVTIEGHPVPLHCAGRKRSVGSEERVNNDDDNDSVHTSSITTSSSIICVPNTCSPSLSTSTVAVSTTSGYRGSSSLGLDSEGDALDGQDDSWSEEEGEVDDSDDYVLRRKKR